MISKFHHVKFARFVWVTVGEESKQRLEGNLETTWLDKMSWKGEKQLEKCAGKIPLKICTTRTADYTL